MVKVTGGDGTFVPEPMRTETCETWNEDCKMPVPTETLCPGTAKNCDYIPIGPITNNPCNAVCTIDICQPDLTTIITRQTVSCETACCLLNTAGCA